MLAKIKNIILIFFAGFIAILTGKTVIQKRENNKLKDENKILKQKAKKQLEDTKIKEFQAINLERKGRFDEKIKNNNSDNIKPNTVYRL